MISRGTEFSLQHLHKKKPATAISSWNTSSIGGQEKAEPWSVIAKATSVKSNERNIPVPRLL